MSEILEQIEWARNTIKDRVMFGMDGLQAAYSRERRANGTLLSCKQEILKLRCRLTESEGKLKEFKTGREMLEVQGGVGTFNYSSYDHGLYNGMEFMLSLIEKREPNFRDAPKKWLHEGKFKTFLRKLFRKPKYKVVSAGNYK